MFIFNALTAQSSMKLNFIELGLSTNYSLAYSSVKNKIGAGVGVYFHPMKSEKRLSLRFGLDYQLTRFGLDSVVQNDNKTDYNLAVSMNQLRTVVSFPIQLFRAPKMHVFIEPGLYLNVQFPAVVKSNEVSRDNLGNTLATNPHKWNVNSNPDVGLSFAVGIAMPREKYNFEIRLNGNWGPFGQFSVGNAYHEQTVFYNCFLNLGLIWGLKMK